MSDLFALFDATERASIATLVKPASHDDPLPPLWPANGIAPHPYASINRMMNADEARELRADIDAHGLLERIVIFEDKILDGRNRYLECVALGRFGANVAWRTHPDFVEFGGKGWDGDRGTDPLAFVWGMEVRRHRSAKDTALAAARYLRFIRELSPQPLADRPEGGPLDQSAGSPLHVRLRLPSQADLSKRYGISERLINSAFVLLDRAEPAVVAAVEQGTLALTDAADVVSKLDRQEQLRIAENPDRKSTKAAVRAAKPRASRAPGRGRSGLGQPPMPPLPDPLSRTELMAFAEEAIHSAQAAFTRHKGPGASISADAILKLGRKHKIVEPGEIFGFTRAALLVMGKLRDMPETAPAKPEKADKTEGGPKTLALGGEWSLRVGNLDKKHSASIAVFHEEDETYSIAVTYDFGVRSGSGPFYGSYPEFREAVAAAAVELVTTLVAIAEARDSVTTDGQKKSAHLGHCWLEEKLLSWGMEQPLPRSEDEPADVDVAGEGGGSGEVDASPDAGLDEPRAAYKAALEAAKASTGKHTIKTIEPILRAGIAAKVTRQRIADDTGSRLGSILGWSARLGLSGQGTGRSAPRTRQAEGAQA